MALINDASEAQLQRNLGTRAVENGINEDILRVKASFSIISQFVEGNHWRQTLPNSEKSKIICSVSQEFCSICFETCSDRSGTIITSCQHHFHAVCLVKSLASGSCNSCPLCRRPAETIVAENSDGDCLRFLAMLMMSLQAVEKCYQKFALGLIERQRIYSSIISSLHNPNQVDLSISSTMILTSVSEAVKRDCNVLNRLTEFNVSCYEYYKDQLYKYDQRTGRKISLSIMEIIRDTGFSRDCVSRDGKCHAVSWKKDLYDMYQNMIKFY